ncbi:hypothetical protein I5L16_16480 [Serratia marcescens]|nr:hypothetical protein [Serratia marcescens]
MTKAYYWKSQVWGAAYFFTALYYIYSFQDMVNIALSLILSILSFLLYPCAKKALKRSPCGSRVKNFGTADCSPIP